MAQRRDAGFSTTLNYGKGAGSLGKEKRRDLGGKIAPGKPFSGRGGTVKSMM
jgi:hypothetical protein